MNRFKLGFHEIVYISKVQSNTANIYDAGGQRHWKLAGQSNFMWVNGQGLVGFGSFNLRTWYPSELMPVTDQAYTKHYFSEGQRVASALGNGFGQVSATSILEDPLEPIEGDYERLPLAAESSLRRTFDCLGLNYENYEPMGTELEVMITSISASHDESDVYFYHSDHASAELSTGLGSSSFITDGNGDATQHLQYTRTEHVECVPFGEDFIHQQSTSAYYTPFTFSGKERDFETSLSYFGARYYDAGLSIWLSVDPLSDERPSLSPYNYCQWNPVMLVDPTGMLDEDPLKLNGISRKEDLNLFEGGSFQKPIDYQEILNNHVQLYIAGNGNGGGEGEGKGKDKENANESVENSNPALATAIALTVCPEGLTTVAGVAMILYFGSEYLMEGRGDDFWNSLVYEYRHPSQEPTTNPPRGFNNNSLPEGSGGTAYTAMMTLVTGQMVVSNYTERLQQIGIAPPVQAQEDNTRIISSIRIPIIEQGRR